MATQLLKKTAGNALSATDMDSLASVNGFNYTARPLGGI
jgi:hypothetical protein